MYLCLPFCRSFLSFRARKKRLHVFPWSLVAIYQNTGLIQRPEKSFGCLTSAYIHYNGIPRIAQLFSPSSFVLFWMPCSSVQSTVNNNSPLRFSFLEMPPRIWEHWKIIQLPSTVLWFSRNEIALRLRINIIRCIRKMLDWMCLFYYPITHSSTQYTDFSHFYHFCCTIYGQLATNCKTS